MSRWLNWSRASEKSPGSAEQGTDKTNRTGNQSGVSVPRRLGDLSESTPTPVDRNGVGLQEAMMGRSGEIRESERSLREIATTEPQFKIATLLATAYRRSKRVPQLKESPRLDSVNDELANSSGTSVHGVVP
jgi:hypothetical protein